ncbi:unnamed protein product [Cladocopium goreaui]|uniref:EamA domain-containing protein n=1 Tax=Cladocopium goreaui TaxID=2562237 RepID=A0A9P1C9I9_9DINO|nr:unnamed protein product [Cladocopium goreaui]
MRWVLGVALVIFGLTLGTGGMQLIRMSELKKKGEKFVESRTFFVLGMVMNTFFGPLLDVAGYAYASAAVIAPLSGFNVVINAVIAPVTLGEKLTSRRLIASAMVAITAPLSIFFKNHREDKEAWTLERAEDVLLRWRVLFYGLIFAMWFCFNLRLRKRSAKGSALRGFSLAATAGSMAGNMWCTRVAAVFAANCASAHMCTPWGHWLPWVLLTGSVFFAVSNVPYMTKGMQRYETLYVVTVFQASNIVSNSLSALIILQEMEGAPWWKLLGYLGCIVIMMGALWFLVSGEEAICPSNEQDADLRSMLSMEGGELEENESDDEPDIMYFFNAISQSFSNLQTAESQNYKGSHGGEEEVREESNDANC